MSIKKAAIVVKIAGIPQILYGADGAYIPEAVAGLPAGVEVTAINCIDLKNFPTITEEMPAIGGVGKASGVTLRVIDRGRAIGAILAPTLSGVTKYTLASSLDADPTTAALTVVEDIIAAPSEGLLWLGHECVQYSAKNNGTRTFTLSERGRFDSDIVEHLVDSEPTRSFKPQVTTQPILWEHRPVSIWLHTVYANGVVADDGEEILRGFLAREPEQDGLAWVLEITSELAKFDKEIGIEQHTTTLVDGWYYADGNGARVLLHREVLPLDSITKVSPRRQFSPQDITAAVAGGAVNISVRDTSNHFTCFGTARGNNPGDSANGKLRHYSSNQWSPRDTDVTGIEPSGYLGGGSTGYVVPAGIVPVWGGAGDPPALVNEEISREVTATLPAGLHRWPDALIELFNKTFNTTKHADGEFYYLDCVLSADCKKLIVKDSGYDFDGDNRPYLGPLTQYPYRHLLWYPWFRIGDDAGRASIGTVSVEKAEAHYSEGRFGYVTLLPPAKAFWQHNNYIIVRDNIFPEATPEHPQQIRVKHKNGQTILRYESVTQQLDADGNLIGYRLKITEHSARDQTLLPFGNWTGEDYPTIEPYAQFLNDDPRRILLKIMLSGFGGIGFPHATYSVLPRAYGLRIQPDAVDIEGILRFPIPHKLRRLTLERIKPTSARSFFEGILSAIRACLQFVTIDGRKKITLVPLRQIDPLAVVAEIRDRDWSLRDRPNSRRLQEKQTVWRFNTNWDREEEKYRVTTTFYDGDAIDAKNGYVGQAVEINLPGLRLNDSFELVDLYNVFRARFARDAKTFSGGIGWELARTFSVGQVVEATIRDGWNTDGTQGITSVKAQVTKLGVNPVTNKCPIEIVFEDTRVTGFAPVAQVETVLDANTVTLSTNRFSKPGETDYGHFFVDGVLPGGGVPVELVHVGQEENNTTGTLSALAANGTATIVGHGLSVGDRIRGRSWDSSTAALREYAHLSEDGVLGAGNDTGFKYV